MESGIEFFLHLVAMERILVVFLKFKESQERGGKQRFAIERGNSLFTELWRKTSDEWLSRIHPILLQMDRFQLTAVNCNRREV